MNGRRLSCCLFLVCLLASFTGTSAIADERILSYHSEIVVHKNAEMTVTETIRVRAEGKQIRRGIYRDFPTIYKDRYGNRVNVGFDLLAVRCNGQPEAYHLKNQKNGIRIYIGKENIRLRPGEYTYAITYKTSQQLGYFESHDELYWNVTGNGWAFPIDEAVASVRLPGSVPLDCVSHEGYTGPQGSKATFLQSDIRDGCVHYRITRPLGPQEGLTIVATWPKGHVDQPTAVAKTQRLLSANRSFMALIIGLLACLSYYLIVWSAVGKDPAKAVIIPQFKPPDGISAAAARFIRRMGYDHKCFAAGLIDMAVKGRLRIHQKGRQYTLKRVESPPKFEVPPEEQALYANLLASNSSITLEKGNHAVIGRAVAALKKSLTATYEKPCFRRNLLHWAPGIAIAFLSWVALSVLEPDNQPISVSVLVKVLLLVAILLLPCIFYKLMKAPTVHGRKMMDHLDGLRLYMSVAERDRLQSLHPPEHTPEHFEELLPYALALDVEQEWATQFADILEAATAAPGTASGSRARYSPDWYRGTSRSLLRTGAFAGALGGALTSAIRSSSTAPGSSSGSSGGGSSGGGGGGGGGGGW